MSFEEEEELKISPRKRWAGVPRLLGWAQRTVIAYEGDTITLESAPLARADIYKNGEVGISLNSRAWINEHMEEDERLTEEVQDFFEKHREPGYIETMKSWLKKKKWKPLDSGNTYNLDDAYWWGSTFEYVHFETPDGDEGAVIMWHSGGDVRGNYDYPRVYLGSFEEFESSQHEGEPRSPETFLHWNRFFEDGFVWALCTHGFFSTPERFAELPEQIVDALELMDDGELVSLVERITSDSECRWDPGWARYTAILRHAAEERMGQRHFWPGLYERP